jgi:hypothetical protein
VHEASSKNYFYDSGKEGDTAESEGGIKREGWRENDERVMERER